MKKKSKAAHQTIANQQTIHPVFFTAHLMEEKAGRALPGVPTKILGSDPTLVGQQVAKLIKHRYRDAKTNSFSSMPRTKIATVELLSSYLVIRLELPPPHIHCKNRTKAFSRFSQGVQQELSAIPKVTAPLTRRGIRFTKEKRRETLLPQKE